MKGRGAGEQGEEKRKQRAVGLVCEKFQSTFQRLEDWQEKETGSSVHVFYELDPV